MRFKSVFMIIALLSVSGLSWGRSAEDSVFEAALRGDLKSVQSFKNLKAKNSNGETLLILAASNGHSPLVLWLLDQGVSANETDHEGGSALLYAVSSGDESIAKVLIDRGADLSKTYGANAEVISFEAARMGLTSTLEKILDKKPELLKKTNSLGETALHIAVRAAQSETLEVLLKKGVNRDIRNKKGQRAIDLADPKSDQSLIKILSNRGAEDIRP